MGRANDIIDCMEGLRDEAQALHLMRFFKTGPGQYGEGDRFLGIKVPVTRAIVKDARDFPLDEVPALLASEWHEVRLCGLLLLVAHFKRLSTSRLANDSEALLHHHHDLMHKAVGWMLREMGKHVGMDVLRDFLNRHAATMPRTALRYAIEHMEPDERKRYLSVKG